MARGLKFLIQVEEGLNYPYSENKGVDQLRGYREADLRLCFRICKNPVISRRGSIYCLLVYNTLYFLFEPELICKDLFHMKQVIKMLSHVT